MLVKATNRSIKLQVKLTELGRVAVPGEEFEVTENRYEILSGRNKYHCVFVVPVANKVEEQHVQEEQVVEPENTELKEIVEVLEEPVVKSKKRKRAKKQKNNE